MKYLLIAIILTVINFNNIKAKSTLDDKILEITCLGKYTGVFHNFIYVSLNESSTDYYVIRTPWLLTYPKHLKNALKKKMYTFTIKIQLINVAGQLWLILKILLFLQELFIKKIIQF